MHFIAPYLSKHSKGLRMLEREMEDLIAENPDSFFPRSGFILQGRQQSFRGVGRFDLLFTDRHGMIILMELKAVPARYETIDQIARYRDALIAAGATNVLMWIVAPSIPHTMKEFLSHAGIEYTEIHETEFSRVAEITGYKLTAHSIPYKRQPEIKKLPELRPPLAKTNAVIQTGVDEWGFGKGTQPSFLLSALQSGEKTKEQIRTEYNARFHPAATYSEAKKISSFNVFFSDCKRPIGTYHASRSLLIKEDDAGRLSLDEERSKLVKKAILNGILQQLQGLHFMRDKEQFNHVLAAHGIPPEP